MLKQCPLFQLLGLEEGTPKEALLREGVDD